MASPGIWRSAGLAGGVQLDVAVALAVLDRLTPGLDAEVVLHLLSMVEAGALQGAEEQKAAKT